MTFDYHVMLIQEDAHLNDIIKDGVNSFLNRRLLLGALTTIWQQVGLYIPVTVLEVVISLLGVTHGEYLVHGQVLQCLAIYKIILPFCSTLSNLMNSFCMCLNLVLKFL